MQRYARRFTIEETFRDIKDNHFGMGLSATNIRSVDRRDRLLFISAIAQALLTQLGAAGEACAVDRILKTNIAKTRTTSLFNHGWYWYRAIPNMHEERLRPLMEAFGKIVSDHAAVKGICGAILGAGSGVRPRVPPGTMGRDEPVTRIVSDGARQRVSSCRNRD